MAETPVDPGSSARTKALGFSLGFIEGTALVSLSDRTLAEGLVVRALDLELAEVEFPLDLKGGAEEFQRRSTTVRRLVVEAHAEALGRALTDAVTQTKNPVRRVWVRTAGDRLILEARIDSDGRSADFVAALLPAAGEDRTVRLHVVDPVVVGYSDIDPWTVVERLFDAARGALEKVSERVAEALQLVGGTTFAIDVPDALLWGLMPPQGWKVPHHAEAPIRRISITPAGALRVAVGRVDESDETGTVANERDVLKAAARDDLERSVGAALDAQRRGDREDAFRDLRSRLDASGGPEPLAARVLGLGASTESLFEDASDLITDRLQRDGDDALALLARGAIAAHGRKHRDAADAFEKAGHALKRAGRRRHAGLALRHAAKHVLSARSEEYAKHHVRLLEETIALRPDDTDALGGLVEALPKLGRASAAVRAARRLANLASDDELRVYAHVRAGELLRDPIGEPVQAKRELERALRIAPEDQRALEGLARAVMDQGDPRRAASIFETLIEKAEQSGDRSRAARLSVVLGDLWRELDADAAAVRYRRARELDRTNVSALARLAAVASEAGKNEAAMEAVEAALPMLEDGQLGGDREAALSLRLTAGRLYEEHASLLDEAIVQYDAALALAPESTDALEALARLYERQGNKNHRAEIIDRHAKMLAASGELEGAAQRWVEEARINADDPTALDRVYAALNAAIAKDRAHRGLLDALVQVAQLGKDPARVIDAIDRRLVLDDAGDVRSALLTQLGGAFESAGRVLEAARAYEEALAADERAKTAADALVHIYRSRDDGERLAAVLERAADLADDHMERADLLAERARLLTGLGRDDEALRAAVDSLASSPESTKALPLATSLAIKLGKLDEAKRYAMHRLAVKKDAAADERLPIYVDLARVAEGQGNRDELIEALEKARDLADPESETGRQISARLARELYGAERLDELAELQRRRGRVSTASPAERAERFIEAARLSSRIGRDDQAKQDVEEALSILGNKRAEVELKLTALDVLEESAKKREELGLLADVLGRRAQIAFEPEEKERLRLEQADVLERREAYNDAVTALTEATRDLPSSLAIAERLGRAAQRAGDTASAAAAYGRAAGIAEERGAIDTAIEMHGRAAETYALMRERHKASTHDRALVDHCAPGVKSAWLSGAMERLERYGRDQGDHRLLADILGRRAASAGPEDAARMLLEKAEVHLQVEGGEREALDALRRARHLAPSGTEIASAVDDRLVELLEQLGAHAEQAAVLVECAERATDGATRAGLFYRAAQLYAERLRDRGMALSRAQAAVRADPSHDEARALRIRLLREGGRRDALAEALSEEAELCHDAKRAAELWMEAAGIITPPSELPAREKMTDQREVEHSLALVRRAATASPSWPAPLAAAATYTRALGRHDEELVALGQLSERDDDPRVRVSAQVRRVDLLAGPLDDAAAAQAELSPLLAEVPDASSLDIQPDTAERLELERYADLRTALLYLAVQLTEKTEDWETHVRVLGWLVETAEDPQTRAELRTRAGGVLEWKIGDGESAEREYLAALALLPDDDRPRKALEQFYKAVDRFVDIGENLGTETLVRVWNEIKDVEPPNRVIFAATALWPKLEEGSEERAEVQLRLADLYVARDAQSERADAVHILEQIVGTAPRSYQDAALERLRVFFLENDRADLYCDVLRRQAERIEDNARRALALAELGEALEWKVGDGLAAENEYRAALAADANCEAARTRLAKLLSSQDRYEEIGRDLGVEILEALVDELLGQSQRDRERVFLATDALVAKLPIDRRGAQWLRVADAFEFDQGEGSDPAVRSALQRASETEGPNQKQALTRLTDWLAKAQDRGELANVLRRRISIEKDPQLRGALHIELGGLVMAMLGEVEGLGREAIEEEAERELRAGLDVDPRNEEARALLERLYLDRGRYLELGRVLGRDVLERLRSEAESAGDGDRMRGVLSALAEMSEGTERAALLVELVGHAGDAGAAPGLPRTTEDLYRAALVADPAHATAREGLRALLESEGRYREIAEALDISALMETVDGLRQAEAQHAQLLPAALSLVTVLDEEGAPASGRAALWTEIADLHLEDGDGDAAERALRAALDIQSDHEAARESLRELLVAERRLADLADVDEGLLATTAQRASEAGDLELQIAALDVLASRKSAEPRADTLVLIAALERERNKPMDAEARLLEALEVHPPHALARSELEALLWSSRRYAEIVDRLGADAMLARIDRHREESPDLVRAAAESTAPRMSVADRAHLYELVARIPGDISQKLDALQRSRELWDELEDAEGRSRVRLAIVAVKREMGDRSALLLALESAHAYATTDDLRASLAVERASLLAKDQRTDAARGLVEPLIADLTLPRAHRQEAARLLVEDLIPPDLGALDDRDLQLRARSLEVLTELPSSGPAPEEAERWFLQLSAAREALAEDSAAVAAPLESALGVVSEEDQALDIRRRLVELYEEVGDWGQAERHASFIAEADDDPNKWVQLSELRVWLDDPNGAQAALDRALELEPASEAAHESMIRLAEQSGESQSVITRLEAWAEVDAEGDSDERARRLLRAAKLAVIDGNQEKAALLAERAVTLVPRGDPSLEAIAREACAVLEPGLPDARVAILTRVVQETDADTSSRLMLADLLGELGRHDEARTVVEQGIHRETAEDDALVERLIEDSRAAEAESAARRLLATAERLGAGPAARRLRIVGAELAESAGERETARVAWSNVASEVGAGETTKAREALVRLTRDMDDAPALVAALEEAALDASTPHARAAKWAEAAEVVDKRLDDPARAESLLARAIAELPEDDELRRRRIELLEGRGRHVDLLEALAQEADKSVGMQRAKWLEREAELASAKLRDDQKAAELWREVFGITGQIEHAAKALQCYRNGYDVQAVLKLADEATTIGSPHRVRFEIAAAEAQESQGNVPGAIERLDALAAERPEDDFVQYRRRDVLFRHGRWAELARALQEACAHVPLRDGVRWQLAAARIYVDHEHDRMAAEAALSAALALVERWLEAPGAAGSGELSPGPEASANLSERATLDAPLLDLAHLADQLENGALRVDALRLYAQSLSEGPEQWRALLLLASAERATGDLDAAEFTLRGVVEAVRESTQVAYTDRVEAERSLGALLLDRGHVEEAVEALERAAKMLSDLAPKQDSPAEAARERAQVLVLLASAYRTADRAKDAVATLLAARALAPEEVFEPLLDQAIEAVGPSPELAELLERRAEALTVPRERAAMLYEAARTWEVVGNPERAFAPWIAAHEADASNHKEAVRLQEALYEAERSEDLAKHIKRRLEGEELTDAERSVLLVARGKLCAEHLDDLEAGLAALERAAQFAPSNAEVHQLLADYAMRAARDDVAADALARLATVATSEIAKRRALVRRAEILMRQGSDRGARQCLEEAVEGALAARLAPRALIDRLAAAYRDAGDHTSAARTLVRASSVVGGAEKAAYLFRAGDLREHQLDDRRGAMAAYEAAARAAPADLGLRRALIRLARVLGDTQKAKAHANAAAEAARQAGDDVAASAFERTPSNGAERLQDAASLERRTLLDRSGRWEDLGKLEEEQASHLDDPVEQAAALVEAGRMYVAGKTEDLRKKAIEAFSGAIERDPDNVDALEQLARIYVDDQAWQAAAPIVARLEALGGPAWPAPEFELAGAKAALAEGDPRRAMARLVQGTLRDPGSVDVKRELMSLAHVIDDPAVGAELVTAYEAALDPVLDIDALGAVHAERSLLAIAQKDMVGALREVERTLEIASQDERAHRLRRRILEESGDTLALLDALEEEAATSDDDSARQFLLRALDLAQRVHDGRRGRRIAQLLTPLAGSDRDVWERIYHHFRVEADGAGMLEAADKLGDLFTRSGSIDERAALAKACFEAGRGADAARLLVGAEDGFIRAVVLTLAQDDEDAAPPRLTTLALEALSNVDSEWTVSALEMLADAVPDDLRVSERLVRSYAGRGDRTEAAAAIHRRRLADEPADLARIQALAAIVDDPGVTAARAWLEEGTVVIHRETTADGEGDPRVAGLGPIRVDTNAGATVAFDDGVVVIGEALADDASPTEIRFLVVREIALQNGVSETIADRRALDASGDLAGAIRALRRLEPRTWSERLVTRDDRVACVRRWRPISDLFAYALSGDYAAALSRSL